MMIILWIIVAFLVFTIVVLIHELWHFAAARKFGVRVEEFWLWIPPRAKKLFYDKKWTLFSLNWLPIWGFVKLTWEQINTFNIYDGNKKIYNNYDLEKDIKNNKDIYYKNAEKIDELTKKEILFKLEENKADYNLSNKNPWQQAIIILAWVFMNFLLAFLIFFILFMVWIKPIGINSKIDTNLDIKIIPTYENALKDWLIIKDDWIILYPIEWSIAEKAGIYSWSILYSINGIDIKNPNQIINIIEENKWKNIELSIIDNENNNKNIDIIVPLEWKIWAYLSENISINDDYIIKYSFIWAWKQAFIETKNQILLTFKWIWLLIKKIFNPETPKEREEAIESMSWPIWIVNFISNSLSAWFVFIIIIWAIISINLWVFNLLPIPALDWWRFLFITVNSIIKKIFWKKIISEKIEWFIHFWFFVLLIALSLIIAYNDINKIIS